MRCMVLRVCVWIVWGLCFSGLKVSSLSVFWPFRRIVYWDGQVLLFGQVGQ